MYVCISLSFFYTVCMYVCMSSSALGIVCEFGFYGDSSGWGGLEIFGACVRDLAGGSLEYMV